jgi:hypothetical protein
VARKQDIHIVKKDGSVVHEPFNHVSDWGLWLMHPDTKTLWTHLVEDCHDPVQRLREMRAKQAAAGGPQKEEKPPVCIRDIPEGALCRIIDHEAKCRNGFPIGWQWLKIEETVDGKHDVVIVRGQTDDMLKCVDGSILVEIKVYAESRPTPLPTVRRTSSGKVVKPSHAGIGKITFIAKPGGMPRQAMVLADMASEVAKDGITLAEFEKYVREQAPRLNTRQDPWRIYKYYEKPLLEKGAIKLG